MLGRDRAGQFTTSFDEISGEALAGAAYELTDPTGSKRSTGRVADRAFPHWVALVAEDHGYRPRQYRRALDEVPDLVRGVAQFREWSAWCSTSHTHLWRTSDHLVDQ